MSVGQADRAVLLVAHTGRRANLESAGKAAVLLDAAGIAVRVLDSGHPGVLEQDPVLSRFQRVEHEPSATDGVELVLVLGGDGTFLILRIRRICLFLESTWVMLVFWRSGKATALMRQFCG